MCDAGWFGPCSRPNSAPEADSPIDCAVLSCPTPRHFLVVYGDPGLHEHNLGSIFKLSAETHAREIRTGTAPGSVPTLQPTDVVTVAHIGTASDLANQLNVNNVLYLAYFGHSWNNGDLGVLLIGEQTAPDTNLTNVPGPNNTPLTILRPSAFRSDAVIQLFGCRGANGTNSIAEQLAVRLHVSVSGYDNAGGSIGTNDKSLGHFGRSATQKDIDAQVPSNAKDLWLVPANGTPHFKTFK